MYNLLRKKNNQLKPFITAALLVTCLSALGQKELNLPNHDDKRFYIGIGIMYNSARFQMTHHPNFLQNDSILSVNPLSSGGIGLEGINNFVISPRFSVRAALSFMLSSKNLEYHLKYPDASIEETPVMIKRVETIACGIPVHLKFRSDRINNFRVYVFGGGKFEFDLASNAKAKKADDLIKLQPYTFGVEAGMGFNFYFPVFILSPEIKISNGLNNLHSRDANLKFSSVIDKLNSRMIVFSLIFEG
ncbi:MAG: outer membrane beta-barrel protein [Chitinophagaceae bacterium]|nr:outer membrane beta-barrel protein [Chitinophagaceae bacterium]